MAKIIYMAAKKWFSSSLVEIKFPLLLVQNQKIKTAKKKRIKK